MHYVVHAKLNAFSVVVETAAEALAKTAELVELGHADILVRDLLGNIIHRSTLEAEADAHST